MKPKKKHTPHTFAGQHEAEHLVDWLNREEPPRIGANRDERAKEIRGEARTHMRIATLVEDLNRSAETYIREARPDTALNKRIDDELSRHTLKVKVVHPQDAGRHKTFAAPKWVFGWYSSAGSRVAEMIFTIVRLGERGLLARVRTCARCGRWFYAKFNHQRFCGNKCQLLHYQTSEEWKARRRERYREQKF
jgi:hypothetical protein